MKFRFAILALSLLIASSAQAAMDLKYCLQYLNHYNPGIVAFSQTPDGRLTYTPEGDTKIKVENGNPHFSGHWVDMPVDITFELKDGLPVKSKIIMKGESRSYVYTASFEAKRGKCFPAQVTDDYSRTMEERDANGKPIVKASKEMSNIHMCRELKKFLANTPDAAICKCGNASTDKALTKIIKKYDPSYSGQRGPREIQIDSAAEHEEVQKFLERFSNPLSDSADIIYRCALTAGLGNAMTDKKIWGNGSAAAVPESDAQNDHATAQ